MPTLKDQFVVTLFASHTYKVLYKNWGTLNPRQRADSVFKSVTTALKPCGVPLPGLELKTGMSGCGAFDFKPWKLQVNPGPFNNNTINKNVFIEIASTFYHETRHCEQWWHMARYAAMVQTSFIQLANDLGISAIVAGQAMNVKMKHNDQMLALVKTWYDSVYGSGANRRDVVLHVSNLNRTGNDHVMHGFRNGAFQQYAGSLAEEKDAWAVEKLMADQLKLLIPAPPRPTTRAPRYV